MCLCVCSIFRLWNACHSFDLASSRWIIHYATRKFFVGQNQESVECNNNDRYLTERRLNANSFDSKQRRSCRGAQRSDNRLLGVGSSRFCVVCVPGLIGIELMHNGKASCSHKYERCKAPRWKKRRLDGKKRYDDLMKRRREGRWTR